MDLFDVCSEGPPGFINEQTRPELDEIEVIDESPLIETRDDWVISIKEKVAQAQRDNGWGKLCIYRIPQYLHQKHYKSYLPETVSLGPYHHGVQDLAAMERHKWRAVNMVMLRTKHNIEMYINAMADLEEKARACYQGPIALTLTSNKFTEMLVFDGCFVLEILNGSMDGFEKLGYDRNDPVFTMRGLIHSIQRDMVLLENQLPLFVLNRLSELQLGTQSHTGLVAMLAVNFFSRLTPTNQPATEIENSLEDEIFYDPLDSKNLDEVHILDVFRRSLLRSGTSQAPKSRERWYWGSSVVDKRQQGLILNATKLWDAGIKFRRRQTDIFWDINFHKGYLEIPRLFIHDGTKSLFLNLIAFEQCHIDSSNDITSYIVFMDNLIDSSEDVKHLCSSGIIEHWLESDSKVADLFNRLGQEIVFNVHDSYLSKLSDDATRYQQQHNKYYRTWSAWMSTLKEKYFDSPWAYISFFAAFILLVLTFSQSYFAAYAYFKSPS